MTVYVTAHIDAHDIIDLYMNTISGQPYAVIDVGDTLTIFVNDRAQAKKLVRLLQGALEEWEMKDETLL